MNDLASSGIVFQPLSFGSIGRFTGTQGLWTGTSTQALSESATIRPWAQPSPSANISPGQAASHRHAFFGHLARLHAVSRRIIPDPRDILTRSDYASSFRPPGQEDY